jgi:hypothetical protein
VRDLADFGAPAIPEIVELLPPTHLLVRDLLNVPDGVQLVPAAVARVVGPAPVHQHQIVRLQIAAAVEITVVVRARHPGRPEDGQKDRQERQQRERDQEAQEAADQRNLAHGVVDRPPERGGGCADESRAIAFDLGVEHRQVPRR